MSLLSKKQPLRIVEEILVWKGKNGQFFPQRVGDEERTMTSNGKSTYYNPTKKQEAQVVHGRYQTHFMDVKREIDRFSTRPKQMIRLFYDTYSKEGDVVLDPFCNNALTSTCCPGRTWIGIDLFHEPTHLKKEAFAP